MIGDPNRKPNPCWKRARLKPVIPFSPKESMISILFAQALRVSNQAGALDLNTEDITNSQHIFFMKITLRENTILSPELTPLSSTVME